MTVRLLLPVLLLALAGCAARAPLPDIPWSAEAVTELARFTVHGKVGFRRGDQGGSAALTWIQQEGEYELSASGPLGQGATRIRGNDRLLRIDNGKDVRESTDPEGLLAEALGWPVSINSLAFWVRGLPAPGTAAEVEYDEAGRPSRIRQQDWDIRLDRWRADGHRVLPHRVVATGGDSRVTLLIERWDTGKRPR